MERRSRNTQENAEFTKAIAAPKNGERWLLVTSAYHMPRSVGLFRKAGFAVEPYPVDWRVGQERGSAGFSPSPSMACSARTSACVNGSALLAYRLTGKIDRLLPGPIRKTRSPPVATGVSNRG